MFVLEMNEQEKGVVLALFDLAVKSGGMQVAEAAVVLTKKIVEQKPAESKTEE